MNKITFFKTILFLLLSTFSYAQNAAYYVSQENGLDSNDGLSSATPFKTIGNIPKTVTANGDTAFEIVLMGTFVNDSYYSSGTTKHTYTGDISAPFIWNSENTLNFSGFQGQAGKYITIRSFDSNTKLKGNGSNILRVQNSEYLIIKDLVIEGEVQSIALSTANDLQFSYLNLTTDPSIDRYNPTLEQIRERDEDDCIVPGCDTSQDGSLPKINGDDTVRPSYVDTRGFFLSNINNVQILNNTVTQMPGGGLRVSDAEDVDIIGNEVSYCSLRSFSGTHGLVVTKATSTRTTDDYRIRILRNKVHHNYNEQYSWAPDKDKITPHIDEGKGISLQRNQTTYEDDGTTIKVNWEHGRILVANNLTYFNGFSGVHSNDGNRVDFINNTSYFNSYTKSITEDDDGDPSTFPTSNNGGNIGISMSDGFDCKIINNISIIDSRLSKSAISVKNSTIATSSATEATRDAGTPDAEIKNNLIYGTTLAGVTGTINENATTNGIQLNSIKADPQFVDPTNFDFRLKITSPAINAADNTEAITTDFNEDPRFGIADMGALEFDANVTLWEGTNSSSWSDAGNWSNGVPLNDNTYAINIPAGLTNYPEITTAGVSLKDMYINTGGTLNIAPTGSLTVERDLTQDGTFTIKSDATNNGSFILKGDQKGLGNVAYDRYVTTNWHLVSSPVDGQNINDFAADLERNSENYAVAAYDNSLDLGSRYTYFTDNTGTNDIAFAGFFNAGKGYSVKKTAAGTLTFSGLIHTDATPVAIVDGVSGAIGNKWNLVGNPSTAFINLNDDADATNNFLTVNATKLDPLRVAVYMWNGSGYDILNHSGSAAYYAAPGQGFFVQAKDGGETINFTEEMQSHQTGKSFFKSSNLTPEIEILVSSKNITKKTQIKYLQNTTTGLDPGYDAGTFSAEPSSFDIYTHLVSNSEGHNFALQCLPNSNYETMIVPLGVTAEKDANITFTSKQLNLPTGINVYIEDKVTNTFTQIDAEKSSYTITLNEAVNGIGRFYIHTTSNALNVNTFESQNVQIYSSSKNTIEIAGLHNKKSNVTIFDLVGKKVFSHTFEAKGHNQINLPNLKVGVYVVNLQSEKGNISKKIVLK
ncbi:T9SS type A sorting domain-containing protein [Polaribacter aestuariivivens]|uniref:T9SS type A sorting domain-containing protein n=1 Tax=Polaribacter aestuariivivens TaxID=2304626 RepID=A0A5S3N0K9_9FLAO|nr:T9SS type A sorting domain-containing protein [Polaribacter aestuariivivens]TMM28808.1 T9SS type A sorting domain-containing protein [Polaribacter aestuariivivens]